MVRPPRTIYGSYDVPVPPRGIRKKLDSKNLRPVERYLKVAQKLVKENFIKRSLTILEPSSVFCEGQVQVLIKLDEVLIVILLTAKVRLQTIKAADLFSTGIDLLKLEKHYCKKLLDRKGATNHFSLK